MHSEPSVELTRLLDEEPSFIILSHEEPDGDCLGSSLALASFLKRRGKEVIQLNSGPFLRGEIKTWSSSFLPKLPKDFDERFPNAAVLLLDCSSLSRAGEAAKGLESRRIVVIDHHSSTESEGDIRYVDSESPAASLLILRLIEAMNDRPSKEEAEYLFFAFATDTGFFRHLDGKSERALQEVSRLVKAGASPKDLYFRITGGKTYASRKHLAMLLQNMRGLEEGKLIVAMERLQDSLAHGRENRDSDAFYQQALAIAETEVVLVLREDAPGRVTGGLRSRSYVDCGKIAQGLGGGGHQRAAGFLLELDIQEAEERVIPLLIQALKRVPDPTPLGAESRA